MRRAAVFLVLASLGVGRPPAASGYESGTTHPGLTAQAMLQSRRLHAFLRQDLGLGLGLFSRLEVQASALSRIQLRNLRRDFLRLDPAGGYRPDSKDGQRAAGWLMAGSVLAGLPASVEENHFYSPVLKEGLDNREPFLGWLLGALSVVEGGERTRQFLTGTGFDLHGASALELVRGPAGLYSAPVIHGHLARAVLAAEPAARQHHLALALIALGGLLHVLQDMASPTRTRNDFVPGHLQKLGSSSFDRGSSYERAVALAYGQSSLPAYTGRPVTRTRLLDYFTSSDWQGLADRTSAEHFSPGTVPPPIRVFPFSRPDEIRDRLAARLTFSQPRLDTPSLRCAQRRTCHLIGPNGPRLAYRVDAEGQLRFFIDDRCIAASARQLLPLAIGYSAGAIDFLLRGRLVVERNGDEIVIKNGDLPMRSGRLSVVAEAPDGRRRVLVTTEAPAGDRAAARQPLKAGEELRKTGIKQLPPRTAHLFALLEGVDESGEPLLAAGHLWTPAPGSPASGPATAPLQPLRR